MRVLHLVGRSQHRGAEQVALELAPELERLGIRNDVVACAPGFDGATDPALPPLAPRVHMDAVALMTQVRKLRQRLAPVRYDVVLAHGGWAVQVAVLARRSGHPLVVWQRILGFTEQVGRPVRRLWWQYVARHIDATGA